MAGLELFQSEHYREINRARLDHLATLHLPISRGTSVLDVGCGPGDHIPFYLERGCKITAVDARAECIVEVRRRFSGEPHPPWRNWSSRVIACCMDAVDVGTIGPFSRYFDVVHCYGLLYHVDNPATVLTALSLTCNRFLVLETCVQDDGADQPMIFIAENAADATQSFCGIGCRPTRLWVMNELRRWFPYVYVPATQPDHPEFPQDWAARRANHKHVTPWPRAVFIASRVALENDLLLRDLPDQQ